MRREAYGQNSLTPVDHFGIYLSRRPVLRVVRCYQQPEVLDIGCGYRAQLLSDLLPLIKNGVGIDLKISDVAKATPGLTFYEETVERAFISLEERQFDVVMMISVLEHLWEPQQILSKCHELLRSGGVLVVNVPNWLGKVFLELSAFKLGLSPAYEMDDHKMYYAKRDLWPLLVRAGFKPSHIRMRYHKLGLNLFTIASKE